MISNRLPVAAGQNLSPNLSHQERAQVARALAAAAAALAAAARALAGTEAVLCPDPAAAAAAANLPAPDPAAAEAARLFPSGPGWRPDEGLSLAQAMNEFLRAKARADRSDRYLRQLRVSLGSFARGRAAQSLVNVRPRDLEAWLEGSAWSARTRRGYLADLAGFFSWAVRRGYLERSPVLALERPAMPPEGPPPIHTPDQVAAALNLALQRGADLARAVALSYFAGIRSAELLRLVEADLDRGQGWVQVPAAKSKTRSRRLVRIRPNLAAWLELEGTLPVRDGRRRLRMWRLAVERAGIPWGRNAPRHSFVSYALAAEGSAAQVALEAGHSEAVLFRHYRALATPAAAAAFWGIRP